MLVGRVNLLMRPYSAMAIREWERATLCKRTYPWRKLKDGIADRFAIKVR